MGYVDVAGVGVVLPDGRELFADVSFRVGEGAGPRLGHAGGERLHPRQAEQELSGQ